MAFKKGIDYCKLCGKIIHGKREGSIYCYDCSYVKSTKLKYINAGRYK